MENRYSYAVYSHSKFNMALHFVEIRCPLLSCCAVFSRSSDAKAFIAQEKQSLSEYGIALKYDVNLDPHGDIVRDYRNSEGLFSKVENRQIYIKY